MGNETEDKPKDIQNQYMQLADEWIGSDVPARREDVKSGALATLLAAELVSKKLGVLNDILIEIHRDLQRLRR